MRRSVQNIAAGVALSCLPCLPGAAAEPRLADTPPAEQRALGYSGDVPACDDSYVLAQIKWSFFDREKDYWKSELDILSFETTREIGYRTRGASFIPRRFCEARAAFNDGGRRKVTYTVSEGLGFLGLGSGVEWCVEGLDRNLAYAPDCAAAGR